LIVVKRWGSPIFQSPNSLFELMVWIYRGAREREMP